MVGPQDGGFGFDQSKKYTAIENIDEIWRTMPSRST